MFQITLISKINFKNKVYAVAFSFSPESKQFTILKSSEINNQNQPLSCQLISELAVLIFTFNYNKCNNICLDINYFF